ncbi:glycerol dehydrogenase [Salmonella enterica]
MITTAIFPGRYIQGANAIEKCLGNELARFGKNAMILEDPIVHKNIGGKITEALNPNVTFELEIFNCECCDEEIERISTSAQACSAEMIVGIGGGKTLDTAKAVGAKLNIPIIVIPTLASTDAPCSSLVVIYTAEGQFKRYMMIPHNPSLVFVDSQVIADAPVRFLLSGIGDAVATWFEAEDCRIKGAGNMTGRPGPMSAYALAKLCFDTLLTYSEQAVSACRMHQVTPALEHVIEANTLLSGLGFESGGLAAAHAIHNGLTVLPETHKFWHGEKVAFGTLAMLLMTDREPDLIRRVYQFYRQIGLPVTLAEIGITDRSVQHLMEIALAACQQGETMHNEPFEIRPENIVAALIAADEYGRRYY